MHTRILGLVLLAVSPALLLVRVPASNALIAEPDARPTYKSPLDIQVDKDGKTAQVVLQGTRTTATVDLIVGKITREEPWPQKLEPPGECSWHFPASADVKLRQRAAELLGRLEIQNARGVWLGEDLWLIVHQRPKFNLSATQVAQGWVFTNALTWYPAPTTEALGKTSGGTIILDEPYRGYADPSDVVAASNKIIFVSIGGADMVLALDGNKIAPTRHSPREDLTTSRHFIKARLPTQANPRRLGLSGDGKTLVVSNYLGDSLTVIDTEKLKVIKHIPLGGPPPDAARRGEILFNSGKMTFQGAFACASCHPNGGADGLNWDLTRDGVGNCKNTKSLLGVRDTAPYGWEGMSATLEDRVTGTLRSLHQHEPTGTEVADLVAYLKSLPPPKPVAVGDKEAFTRGKELFEGKARCATCHKRAGYDDGKSHDVGTRGPTDTSDLFDTPSLRGVARTAPYLHDGRAATLEEIFTRHNPEKRHGAAHLLSDQEFRDLMGFLRSL